MKKITNSLIAISAMLIAFSCTKDLADTTTITPNGKQLELTAAIDESRVARENDGKLSWTADDALGLFVGSDINIKAATNAELVAEGKFLADGITAESGTIYAYYPYNTFASQSTGTADVWLSIAQGQTQSAKDVFDAGKYFTMVSNATEWDGVTMPNLQFTAAGSVLRFNIYDTTGAYVAENIQSVEVVSDNALVGGYQYNLATREYDMTSSINRKAAIVYVAEPFAVGDNANVYMAVLPGSHTPKIVVRTDGGAHVFEFSSALVCEASKVGTVKLNLGNAAVKHYVLYNTFDLLIWGGDYMHNGEAGYSPLASGQSATSAFEGEEPYIFANTESGTDGSASFDSMTEKFRLSRGLNGYTWKKAYERPGHIKLGTGSAGYTLGLPKLTGLTSDAAGETIKLTFTANRWSSASDDITLTVEGGGLINGTDESIVVDIPKYTGGVANAPANIVTLSYTVYGATSNTSLTLSGSTKLTRTNLDDIFVERVAGASPLLAISGITATTTADSAHIEWEAVAGAVSYKYVVSDDNGEVKNGSTDTTSVDIDGLAATTKYYISVQAVADVADAAHTDGVWSDEFEFYTISAISDVHESGYVFFEDNLEWMNTEEFKGTWHATASENCFRMDALVTTLQDNTTEGIGLTIWNEHGWTAPVAKQFYTYIHPYSHEDSYFRFGRAYKSDGSCVGTMYLPADALKDATEGASLNVVFSVDMAKSTDLASVNSDYGVAVIKAITDGVEDVKNVTLDNIATLTTYTVEFNNVKSTTQFVIGNTIEGSGGKADRFIATNFKIAKK
ncbi:MAG: fibronectin type III domain-containing protein [Alistipes sp.]